VRTGRLPRRSAVVTGAALLGVLVSAWLSPRAVASVERTATSPPIGAYQEPAPETPNEKYGADFVNELLKRRDLKARVATPELRQGVVLPPVPTRKVRSASPKQPRSDDDSSERQLPQPDAGPAERAGVASPVDQDVPGTLVALAVGVILAAVGVVLEATGRRRRKT
jgi:hypothetical protein